MDKQTKRYLLWAFALAWILQVAASRFALQGQARAFQLLLLISMYAPFAAVLLAKIPLRGMGWRPRLRGKLRYVLAAWFAWAILGALGAALYYWLFPSSFDPAGTYYLEQIGEAGQQQMEAQGLSLQTLFLLQAVSALTYAPLLNTLAALGEEVGWRGALYPRLKERFGSVRGRLLGGVIWGVWHWPVMILAGYNYGTAYWGAPVLGPLVFCLGCIALGTLFDALYEKTGCIWVPALAHGAYNSSAGILTLWMAPAAIDKTILGPAPIGLIAGLPLFLLAAWVLLRGRRASSAQSR